MDKENVSRIAQSMVVKGAVLCQGRLVLAGVVEGRIEGGMLEITETGRLTGDVQNREVECAGQLQGDIVTESFTLRPTGRHRGTAETRRLTVEPGAVLDCVLQSGLARPAVRADRQEPGPECSPLGQVLTAFAEEFRPSCLDIPWSARLAVGKRLLALVGNGSPLIQLTGDRGSGKSVLGQWLCRNAPEHCMFLSLQADSLAGLLMAVAAELGMPGLENLSQAELLARVKTAAEARRGGGGRLVVVIDGAEAMAPAVLDGAVRFLTSAFGGDDILQLVLVGAIGFEDSLTPAIRDYFAGKGDCQLTLTPLSLKDTADYLRFCLQLAAAGDDGRASLDVLPDETIRTLHVLSRGNLAEINRLADQALRHAHRAGAPAIYPDYL